MRNPYRKRLSLPVHVRTLLILIVFRLTMIVILIITPYGKIVRFRFCSVVPSVPTRWRMNGSFRSVQNVHATKHNGRPCYNWNSENVAIDFGPQTIICALKKTYNDFRPVPGGRHGTVVVRSFFHAPTKTSETLSNVCFLNINQYQFFRL